MEQALQILRGSDFQSRISYPIKFFKAWGQNKDNCRNTRTHKVYFLFTMPRKVLQGVLQQNSHDNQGGGKFEI